MIAAFFLALLCVASILLAFVDLRRGIIPDWLNLAIAVMGLARAVLLEGVGAALAAGSEGIAIGAVVWLLRNLYFMLRKFDGLGLGMSSCSPLPPSGSASLAFPCSSWSRP